MNQEIYCDGYEAALEDKATGIAADRACTACKALLAGKDRESCPRCSGVVVTLDNAEELYAIGYWDALRGYAPAFTRGKIMLRTMSVLAALLLSGPAFAQSAPITISPNTGAGDDSSDISVDLSSETTSEVDNSTTDDHSVSNGDILTTHTVEGYSDRHAERAAASVSLSHPGEGPCGDSTGLGAQGGNVGVSLATVGEACRAARVSALVNREEVPRAFKIATQVTYWAGYLPRLVLHVASFGVLN
jgi:hypothetical protein